MCAAPPMMVGWMPNVSLYRDDAPTRLCRSSSEQTISSSELALFHTARTQISKPERASFQREPSQCRGSAQKDPIHRA